MGLVKSVLGLGRVCWYQKGGGILPRGVMRRVWVLGLGSGSSAARLSFFSSWAKRPCSSCISSIASHDLLIKVVSLTCIVSEIAGRSQALTTILASSSTAVIYISRLGVVGRMEIVTDSIEGISGQSMVSKNWS
jgi:hypothetical protein